LNEAFMSWPGESMFQTGPMLRRATTAARTATTVA